MTQLTKEQLKISEEPNSIPIWLVNRIKDEIIYLEKANVYYMSQMPDDFPGPFLPLIKYLNWVLEQEPTKI